MAFGVVTSAFDKARRVWNAAGVRLGKNIKTVLKSPKEIKKARKMRRLGMMGDVYRFNDPGPTVQTG